MDKIDPSSEGNSKVEVPANEAGNTQNTEDKQEDLSLEESTYKLRYGNSTKENQKLMAQLNLAKKKLGLSESDELTEEEEKAVEEEAKEEEKNEKSAPVEESEEVETDDDSDEEEEKKVVSDNQSPYDYQSIGEKGEEAAVDIIWDNFVERHPDIESNSKLREGLILETKRFRSDALGNRVPLKKALDDAYFWVNRDNVIKKAKIEAKDEGIIEATKNKDGEIKQTSSKSISVKNKLRLSDKEIEIAKRMGISEEDYIKNKVVYEDDEE